ncbi:protoheme IX farnesyltransferase, mitochondrial-like isoform X2 [Penaeus monodon]|uniref:protoheme IX farnesyltransferase, mitochondrial-like isoform X2 n=1 Tax=Penaeus monodon TaxID=6687 RepID=UPI0018A7AB45|nr:protoheme IX farnesyltransferase, mitochondrial-like isoform X2 [Penaeus monodon]
MSNMVWAQGLKTLVLAGQNSSIGLVRSSQAPLLAWKAGLRIFPHRKYVHNRNVSPSIYQLSGLQDGDGTEESVKEVPVTRANGNGQSSNIKILLIDKSKALKSLTSRETPVIHDAGAGAIVDVRAREQERESVPNEKNEAVEVRLQVTQLLQNSRASVKTASNLQPYNEDIEYIDEAKDRWSQKTELVGALKPEDLDWRPQKLDISKLGTYYAGLAKSRLTGLVVITAVAGYAMAPAPLDPSTLLLCSVGTGLVSAAANAINQICEVPYDSQMDRTKNRILVRVGAIPPMIGWASCSGSLEAGAWVMAGVLFAWQFPHFNALSWNLRPDYSRAGYRMMSVTNPVLCRKVALRYSLAMIGICTLAPAIDVTTWMFAVDSLPVNGYLTYLAWRFYQDADSKSSRKLFLFTLLHLPAIMMLMIISKKHYNKKESKDSALGEGSQHRSGRQELTKEVT